MAAKSGLIFVKVLRFYRLPELRPGNIWENVELPRLKNNPNVTKITTIDPKTGVENVV